MRDYGIVSPRFWIGETGKKLRGDANCQVLAMYLMTSPHATMTGVYHCPVLYMAHETGLSMDGATKALARLIHEGYCLYDEASEYVFVLRMAAHQIGESLDIKDRRVIGLRKDVEKMQEPFKSRFLAIYGALYHLVDGTEIPSPSEAPSEPHRSQDQDQDQKQDGRGLAAAPTKKPKRKSMSSIPDDFTLTDERRTYAEKHLPGVNADALMETFRSTSKAKDWKYADWDMHWQTLVRQWAPNSGHWSSGQYPKRGAVNSTGRSLYAGAI